jgi:hypothetical protein
MLDVANILENLAKLAASRETLNARALSLKLSLDLSESQTMPGSVDGSLSISNASFLGETDKIIVMTTPAPRWSISIAFESHGPDASCLDASEYSVNRSTGLSSHAGGKNVYFDFAGASFGIGISDDADQIGLISVFVRG